MSLRIAVSAHPLNISLAIAADVFLTAGVALPIAINLIFAQRLFRASHPNAGFSAFWCSLFRFCYALIPLMVLFEILSTIMLYETLDSSVLLSFTTLKQFADVVFVIIAFLPLGIMNFSFAIPGSRVIEKFGTGKTRSKVAILALSSTLLFLGVVFKTAVAFNVRPQDNPDWFNSTTWFYVTNFLIEIFVVYLYAIVRVDQRFFVPNRRKVEKCRRAKI
jgi:hypothetical protein